MGKAIGIGGVFIHLKGEEKELFDWYEKHLGMDFSSYGSGFTTGKQLMIISFKRSDNPKLPLINLRVDDIESIINDLKNEKIEIISDITDYDYGKFATFIDPFDNPIELWEANEEKYIEMVKKELEDYKTNRSN